MLDLYDTITGLVAAIKLIIILNNHQLVQVQQRRAFILQIWNIHKQENVSKL